MMQQICQSEVHWMHQWFMFLWSIWSYNSSSLQVLHKKVCWIWTMRPLTTHLYILHFSVPWFTYLCIFGTRESNPKSIEFCWSYRIEPVHNLLWSGKTFTSIHINLGSLFQQSINLKSNINMSHLLLLLPVISPCHLSEINSTSCHEQLLDGQSENWQQIDINVNCIDIKHKSLEKLKIIISYYLVKLHLKCVYTVLILSKKTNDSCTQVIESELSF